MLLTSQIILAALATLALLPGANASLGHQNRNLAKVHQKHRPAVEAREVEQPSNSTQELEKRQRRIAHFSWYDTEESGNPGHCGDLIKNYEFVVARKYSEFTLADCGKQIRIFYKGKTAVATIKDSCPGCWDGGFDMSRGLFEFFEWDAVRVGVLDTEWEWVDGAAQPPPPPTTTTQWEAPWTPPPPSSTSVWQPPSSTWVPPSSSSVWSSSVASSSSSSISSSSASRSVSASSSGSASSGSSRPTASASLAPANNTAPQNLQGLSDLIVKMGSLVADGAAL